MFRHVAVFTWKPETTDDQRHAVGEQLASLPGKIPELRGYVYGDDAGVVPGNADFAVVADFDDVDGYIAYRDHPEHRAIIDAYIAPIIASRTAVQFDIG